VDSTRPIDDESQLGWTLQIFRIGGNIGSTPVSFAPSTLIGEASQVGSANLFRIHSYPKQTSIQDYSKKNSGFFK
jgi:hypothetical protein